MGRALRPVFEIMAYGCFAELMIGKTTVLIKEGIRVSCYVSAGSAQPIWVGKKHPI